MMKLDWLYLAQVPPLSTFVCLLHKLLYYLTLPGILQKLDGNILCPRCVIRFLINTYPLNLDLKRAGFLVMQSAMFAFRCQNQFFFMVNMAVDKIFYTGIEQIDTCSMAASNRYSFLSAL